jgi:DNA-binding beta-propeller fold protein YncE
VKVPIRLKPAIVAGAAVAALAGFATPAFASTAPAPSVGHFGASHAVFVQTDSTSGNRVVAYHRAAHGALSPAGSYATDGLGGILSGSVVDHTASQGSLTYDPWHSLLYAVNAGSNTVSVFAVAGDHLALRQVLSSGGTFPVSVAVHGDLVYVVNALNGGSLQGYRVFGRFLVPLPGSSRALHLDPAATPQFVNTPGQVAFTPDGGQLIVTTKANGNDIDVFRVGFGGWLSAAPVVNAEPGAVPFAITFDSYGHLVIAEAGTNAVATFAISGHGTLSQLDSVGTGQAATCWVAPAGSFLFASNAGSAAESGFTSSAGGQLTLLGATTTDAGTVDASAAAGGRFLYVQTGGAGIVDEYAVGASGVLSQIGSVTVPDAVGGEGIVAF